MIRKILQVTSVFKVMKPTAMFNDLSALHSTTRRAHGIILQEMDKETLNWGQSENIEKLRVRHTGELLLVQIVQKQMKA